MHLHKSLVVLLSAACAIACTEPQIVNHHRTGEDPVDSSMGSPTSADSGTQHHVPDADPDEGPGSQMDAGFMDVPDEGVPPDAEPDHDPPSGDSGLVHDAGHHAVDAGTDAGADAGDLTKRPPDDPREPPTPLCLRDLDRDGLLDDEHVPCEALGPAIHAAVAGKDGTSYHNEWDRLTNKLNYGVVTLAGTTMPSGAVRYSSVVQKDGSVSDFFSHRGYSKGEFSDRHARLTSTGYRISDVSAHRTSSGLYYDAVWIDEVKPSPPAEFELDVTLATLTDRLDELKGQGYRLVRLHGYGTPTGPLFSGVWVKDALGTDYRIILDKNDADYKVAFDSLTAERYFCVDISAYPAGDEVRYTGVFIKDPSITRYAAYRDMPASEFAAKQRAYAESDYVLIDVESYSLSTTSDVQRFAAVWVQRSRGLEASFHLDDTHSWSKDATTALDDLNARLKAYPGKAGFLIEDLTNGNYLGYRVNQPFYMAGTSDVLLAAAALDRVDANVLSLGQTVSYGESDILEASQRPAAAGNATVLESLRWMLSESSINAADRLFSLVGAEGVNAYLTRTSIADVGEITSRCELDARIYETQDACARALSCRDLERWLASAETPPSESAQACVAKLSAHGDAGHEQLYATFVNSITPFQYAQLWRRIVQADMLTSTGRNTLLGLLADSESDAMAGLEGVFFDVQAGKSGAAHEAQSWVGVGYDSRGAASVDDAAQYSLALFSEDWPDDQPAQREAARALLQAVAVDALTILRDRR